MDRKTLEQIAERLDGTDDGLAILLSEMDIDTNPFEVEAELKQKLSFGYCQECEQWGDGVRDG